jgi:hypothetical protein
MTENGSPIAAADSGFAEAPEDPMAASSDRKVRAIDAFQPVTDMLDVGECEPLKAAVHGLLMATVSVCAAYNAAAWLKRRQSHLALNAIIYTAAIWWEHTHVKHHLVACEPAVPERFPTPIRLASPGPNQAQPGSERDAA